jgi:adenosylmethionine-8-amino-7-oxononanoate aminotransferase
MRPDGSLQARDARSLWHPYTQHGLERAPLPVRRANGAKLVLEDGREVLDAISSWWTCLHGHGEPRLLAAMARQAAELDHVLFAGCTHEPAVALAEALLARAPRGLARVFYSDDGSTAVEAALKIVLQAHVQRGEPERRVFVALQGAYHGDTFGAMSVGEREPFFGAFGPLLFDVRRTPVEAGALVAALQDLGQRCAGVIVEPLVQGAAGMRMHSAAFLQAVRAACNRHGVPLVADEVMTGFGRTGSLFACLRAGIEPDLLCLAKGLTGGLGPLAATLSTERWFEAFRSSDRSRAFFHGHSFTANPILCAVALESLSLCEERDTPGALERIGARIEARLLQQLPDSLGAGLRRTGGIVAFDLPAVAGAAAGYLDRRALELRDAALRQGVLLRPLGGAVYAMPPACATDDECDRIAGAMLAVAERALLGQ